VRDGIDWAKVGPGERFEKIISTLLSTLHPDSERIDGAGGDGGRDHQFRTNERLDLWQSKSFLGRLSASSTRKRQISESLTAAAALQPDSWTLVTPMVPTPEERTWFDGLQHNYPFPLVWRGGDWLEARLAEHPSIERHFMSGDNEYVALVRELREEQEALVDGLPAALPRIERLAAKINDSNPFYKVDFTVQDGQVVSAHLRPKYRGAEKDSPVTIRFNVVTGPTDTKLTESLRAALDWGETVELPASHVRNIVVAGVPGFEGEHDQADITIGPAPQEPIDVNLRLVIHAPDGRHLAALPAQLITRISGARGVTLHGTDVTGVINTRLRLDPLKSRFFLSLSSNWSRPTLPGAALPILRFMQHAKPPNTLSFIIRNTLTTTPVPVPEALAVSKESVQLVEDLYRLQATAGEPFPIPTEWTPGDQHQLRRAARLVDGQQVEVGDGSVHLNVDDLQPFIEAFANSQTPSLAITPKEPYVAHITGHDLDLGPYTFFIPRAQLDLPSIAPIDDGTYQLRVLPAPGSGIRIALGELTARDSQDPPAPSSGLRRPRVRVIKQTNPSEAPPRTAKQGG
jgi:hypothetical protein